MINNFTILPSITIEILQIKFTASHVNSSVSKEQPNDKSVTKIANVNISEEIVIESIELPENLSYVSLGNLNKLLLQQ